MRVVVPFAADRPKTRLANVFTDEQRNAFARAMLRDVLDAIKETGRDAEILATRPLPDVDASVTVDERPLTPAVNGYLEDATESVAVVMADLALATPAALECLFERQEDVVLAPGRGGGTNALVARHDAFRVDYHGASYLDHLQIADEIGADVAKVDSHRLATDIDERADLAELLIHGERGGRAYDWLVDAGVTLSRTAGRVGVSIE